MPLQLDLRHYETIVAIVSDDNESPLQRTLLLYFALKD